MTKFNKYNESLVYVVNFDKEIREHCILPDRLGIAGLLSESAVEEANSSLKYISGKSMEYKTDELHLAYINHQNTSKLQLGTVAPLPDKILDLLCGILLGLGDCRCSAVGWNYIVTFKTLQQHFQQFGHWISPKTGVWDSIMKNPGTRMLTVLDETPDTFDAIKTVSIQSAGEDQGQPLLMFHIHFERKLSDFKGAEAVVRFLKDWHIHSFDRSTSDIKRILGLYEESLKVKND